MNNHRRPLFASVAKDDEPILATLHHAHLAACQGGYVGNRDISSIAGTLTLISKEVVYRQN